MEGGAEAMVSAHEMSNTLLERGLHAGNSGSDWLVETMWEIGGEKGC